MVNHKSTRNKSATNNQSLQQDQESKLLNWKEFKEKKQVTKRGIAFPKGQRDLQVQIEQQKLSKSVDYKKRMPGPNEYNVQDAVNYIAAKGKPQTIQDRRELFTDVIYKQKRSEFYLRDMF